MLPSIVDLVEDFKHPEGKTLKFEHDLSTPDGAPKPIAALASAAGATLLIFHVLVHEIGMNPQDPRRRNLPAGHTPS